MDSVHVPESLNKIIMLQDSKQLGSSQLEREKREVKPLHSSHKDSNSSHTPTEKPPYNHELPPTATSDITVQSNSAYDDNMDSESVSSESESSDIEVVWQFLFVLSIKIYAYKFYSFRLIFTYYYSIIVTLSHKLCVNMVNWNA